MIELSIEELQPYIRLQSSYNSINWKDEQALIRKCIVTLSSNPELDCCFEIQSGEAVIEALRQSDSTITINIYSLARVGYV